MPSLFFKILNETFPITTLIPVFCNDCNPFQLCEHLNVFVCLSIAKSHCLQNSFLPEVCRFGNDLPIYIKRISLLSVNVLIYLHYTCVVKIC